MTKMFDENLAIIVRGETNASKTTFINTFLSKIGNQHINFYVSNGENKTKITTIIKFSLTISEYIMEYNNVKTIFSTFEDLINSYNSSSIQNNIIINNIVKIQIPTIITRLSDIVFIDTIGISNIYKLEDEQRNLVLLKKLYPNNIILNFVRIPTYSNILTQKNEINLITHADLINYNLDNTLEHKHAEFLDLFLNNKAYFYTNYIFSETIICNNHKIKIYNGNSCVKIVEKIIENYDNSSIISCKTIDEVEKFFKQSVIENNGNNMYFKTLSNGTNKYSIEEAKKILYQSNNSELYSKSCIILDNLTNYSQIEKCLSETINYRNSQQNILGNGVKTLIKIFKHHFTTTCKNNNIVNKICDCADSFKGNEANKTNYFNYFDRECFNKINELKRLENADTIKKILKIINDCKINNETESSIY